MDTESIISALVSAKSEKVTTLKNEQKKLSWKQTMWQDLNSKIYSFYSKTLSNMRLTGDYAKKTTKISDSTKASIVASGTAVNGTQTLRINSIAKAGYLTGARLDKTVSTITGKIANATYGNVDTKTKLTDLTTNGTSSADGKPISQGGKADEQAFEKGDIIEISSGGTTISVTVGDDTTIASLVDEINSHAAQGFSASFDDNQKYLTINGSIAADSNDTSGISIKVKRLNATTTTDSTSNTTTTTDSTSDASTTTSADGSTTATETYTDITTNALKALGLNGNATTSEKQSYKADSKLSSINSDLAGKTISVTTGTGDDMKTTKIDLTGTMTISELVTKFQSAGVNASFDETNQRLFISSKSTGAANDFSLSATETSSGKDASYAVLSELGLYTQQKNDADGNFYATKVDASDAEIYLNGAKFTSSTNTFTVNGLTITASAITADNEEVTITTETDYDGIYDMIKDFISEYNSIINDIYQKYNADSARKYSMLTDDEKEAMTDDEVEEWEDTIKASLLRKDTTLQTLMSSIVNVMNDSYGTDSNGKKRYLFTYGIETLGYFESEEGERYALHIAGDPDDENTSSDDDLLKTALANDPDGTIDFFTSLARKLYSTLNTAMTATDYSSVYKVYEDKRLQTEYDDYTDKISDAEDELSDYEDKWYSKFSSMETALSKLQNTQSVVSSMLGTS
jgi:flagellar hook-associated protein 2